MSTSMAARAMTLLGLLAATLPVRAQLYSAQQIGSLGGSNTFGNAINGYGEATGWSLTPGDVAGHAFLWNGTTTLDLGTLGGSTSEGTAINATGEVTGWSGTPGDVAQHAFLWNGISMVDLGTLGGSNSQGAAINATGEVTGWSDMPGDVATHAFLWNGTTMKDLGTLGGTSSSGVAINDSGQVTGWSEATGNAHSHAFLWNGTSIKDLGTVVAGATTITPVAMNNAGQVVGTASNSSSSVETGFLWDGTKMVALNALGGTKFSRATAINAKGQVTGWAELSTDKDNRGHAYLWTATKAVRMDATSGMSTNVAECGGGLSIGSTSAVVGELCDVGGWPDPFLWDGFAILDLLNIVPSATGKLYSAPVYINNRGQILVLNQYYNFAVDVLSPIPGAIALDLAQPYEVAGCQNVAAYVYSPSPAPPGGLVISLSDNLAAASVPATVTIPAGAIGATFTITTMPVTSMQRGAVTATLSGRTVSQNLSIRPIGVLAVTLTPSTVIGGSSVAGKVTLECGAAPAAITVTISSNPTKATPVPSTIVIPKGQSSGTFKVTTQKVASRTLVTIKGTGNGISATANLKLNK